MIDVKEVMAENDPPQSVCSGEKPEAHESCRQRFQWIFRSGSSKVAAVRPMPRNGNSDTGGRHASPSPSPSPSHSPAGQARQLARSSSFTAATSPSQLRSRQTEQLNCTQLQPFSFDERDSMQRASREKWLEELRLMEERMLTLATRFRANPVRRYKPMVLRQSTRPLTVPRAPFSHQDGE